MTIEHGTGTIASGDVTLFYRRLGKPGATPVLILHGGNYYDSLDWLPIAGTVAQGREVVVFDQRGMGESSWSPSKNYTNDAVFGDVLAVLDHLGWDKAVLIGQSRNAVRAVSFAGYYPERVAGIVLCDSAPGSAPPPGKGAHLAGGGGKAKVFPTPEDAFAAFSNDKGEPGSAQRERLISLTKAVEGGYIIAKRDPDIDATKPEIPGWTSQYAPRNPWDDFAGGAAPKMLLKALRSPSVKPEVLDRIRAEVPQVDVVELDSTHDIPAGAPQEAAAAINRFLRERIDG